MLELRSPACSIMIDDSGELCRIICNLSISYKDRLTRFGFKYLEEFFSSHGVRIEVVLGEEPKDLQQELIEDLIAIVTSFAGRLYGMRSHKKKKVVESVKQAIRDC